MLLAPTRHRSPIVETALLTAALVRAGLRTLVFCRVRRVAELLLQYTHDRLAKAEAGAAAAGDDDGEGIGTGTGGSGSASRAGAAAASSSSSSSSAAAAALIARVKSYRGGYLKSHRRAIEADLFAGRLLAVIATNALELGVDIGSLDVVVMLGYPGSASSLWQQAGRAGRGGRDAAAIMVLYETPLDQAFARTPDAMLARPPEGVHCDPCNPAILRLHAMAAAAEQPLRPVDMALFGPQLGDAVARLRGENLLIQADDSGLGGDPDELQRLLQASAGQHAAGSDERASPTDQGAVTSSSGHAAPSSAVTLVSQASCEQEDISGGAGNFDADDGAAYTYALLSGKAGGGSGGRGASGASSRGAPSSSSAAQHAAQSSLRAVAADGSDLGRLHGWRLAAWAGRPSASFSLRTIDDVSYDVVVGGGGGGGSVGSGDAGSGTGGGVVIDRVEEVRAFWEIHEGAIVMNQGATYRVTQLDVVAKRAYVAPATVHYYTAPRDFANVEALARERSAPSSLVHYGPSQVQLQVFGYNKIARRTGLPFEAVDLVLPPIVFDTLAVWGDVPLVAKHWMDAHGLDFLGGCHGAGHAVMAVLPLHVKCDRTDLGTECPSPHQHRPRPLRWIVHESAPGGVGIAAAAFGVIGAILRDALSLVESCACDDGCAGCIHDGCCKEFNVVLDKAATIAVLRVGLGMAYQTDV